MYEKKAVVLAAGKGTRMASDRPKVLAECCGRPLIDFVLDALDEAGIDTTIVVIGYKAHEVRAALSERASLLFVEQTQQLGTGHAVKVCENQLLDHRGPVLVVTGDSPLIQPASIRALMDEYDQHQPACVLGTLIKDDPTGLGRIVRDSANQFVGIVEEQDATEQQRQITEVNMSTYVFDSTCLLDVLMRLGSDNRQGEYYITDCPGILKDQGHDVRALPILKACEALSVNNLAELKHVESEMRKLTCGN